MYILFFGSKTKIQYESCHVAKKQVKSEICHPTIYLGKISLLAE